MVSFFFNDTATTEIYTLSLHDALPISIIQHENFVWRSGRAERNAHKDAALFGVHSDPKRVAVLPIDLVRSEEHTSELQSQSNLVCRLLLEKKNKHKQLADT